MRRDHIALKLIDLVPPFPERVIFGLRSIYNDTSQSLSSRRKSGHEYPLRSAFVHEKILHLGYVKGGSSSFGVTLIFTPLVEWD
jgi:hypothetical protein